MAYVIASASLSKLVIAHDCESTDIETLDEESRNASEEMIPTGLRWFYCAGLGIALIFMSRSQLRSNFYHFLNQATTPLPFSLVLRFH